MWKVKGGPTTLLTRYAGTQGLTLLCSVSVNLAELWRAPSKGGEGNFEIRNSKFGKRPAFAGSRMCGKCEIRNAEIGNWRGGPYYVPRWRDFEGFSLRSKIKEGLEGRGGGFRLSK